MNRFSKGQETGTSRPPYRPGAYQPALDGLRALAIVTVLLYHDDLLIPGGYLGVDIFFVLSGFLITSLLLEEHRRTGRLDLRHFYLRRALRLFPALAVLLAAATAFALAFPRAPQTPHIFRGVAYSLVYMSNWANARDPFFLGPLGHTWSLAIEEQFYLLWPLVLIALLKVIRRRAPLVVLILGLAAGSAIWRLILSHHGSSAWRLYNGSDTRADSLLVGCAAAAMLSDKEFLVVAAGSRFARSLALVGLALIAGLMVNTPLEWTGYGHGMFSAVALAVAAILVGLLTNPTWLVTRVLSTGVFVRIGRLSYSLYLWHYPIYQFLKPARLKIDARLVMVLRICAALVAALGSFYLVERPFLRLKSRFGRSTVDGSTLLGKV